MRLRRLSARIDRSPVPAAWRLAAAALLLVGLTQPGVTPAQAAPAPRVFTAPQVCSTVVGNSGDAGLGSLRDAVACATTGHTVTFDGSLAGQTILLTTGEITITQPITIDGSGADGLILDAGNNSRIFMVATAGGPVTLTALALQHGAVTAADQGGAIYAASPLGLYSVEVLSSTATHKGGGVYANALITVTNSLFQGNTSTNNNGGGLYASSKLSITGTEFISNTSGDDGGGVYALAPITVTNGRFQGNSCTGSCGGGGLFSGTSLTLTGTEFISNTSPGSGGGAVAVGPARLTNGLFQQNSCTGSGCAGGGLYANGTLVLTGTQFLTNTSYGKLLDGSLAGAGGVLVQGASAALTNGRFQGNACTSAGCVGGGLYASSALALTGTEFITNTSLGGGGGVLAAGAATLINGSFQLNACTEVGCLGGGLSAESTLTLTGTEFSANTSRGSGGGVYAAGAVTLTNGSFQENVCADNTGCQGAGLYSASTLTLTGTEFLSNLSWGGGGAGAYAAGAATLTNGRFESNLCGADSCQGAGLYAFSTLALTGTEFVYNGSSGAGGGVFAAGAATLTNASFLGNSCGRFNCEGGGLSAAGTLTLTGVEFLSNTAVFLGGGVFAAGPATMLGVRFEGNVCTGGGCQGGGLYATSALTMTDPEFIDNTSVTGAGGAGAEGEVTLITNGRFQENTCTGSSCSGGGLTAASALATITGTEFISNTSRLSGGGLYAANSVTVVNGVFQGNTCTGASCTGGGLKANIWLVLTGTEFIANTSIAGGGGVAVAGGAVLTNASFQGNTCTDSGCTGGGLRASGNVSLVRSSFNGNQADSGGGLAAVGSADLTVANVTLSSNTATTSGGGVYVGGTATTRLLNVTVALNSATSAGGGLYAEVTATVGVSNTVIAGNSFDNCGGQIDAGTHNLEFKFDACATAGPADSFTSADPLLDALALNAPGTTWTHALQYGSVARDAGDAATCAGPEVDNLDQRGVTRPIDGDLVLGAVCDIGAYEAAACVPEVTSTADAGEGSLRAAVACAEAGGAVTFDSGLTGDTINLTGVEIIIDRPITIDGSGAPGVRVDAGLSGNRIFHIDATGPVTLTALVLQNALVGGSGGAIYAATPLVLNQVRFLTNTVTGLASHGGGLYTDSTLVLTGTEFIANASTGHGGGVYAGGAVTLTSGRFQGNVCLQDQCAGGGLFAAGALVLTGTQVLSNTSLGAGGGVNAASAVVVNGRFQGNACTESGCQGGAFWGAGASHVASSTFNSNQAGSGGAVAVTGTASLTLANVTLSGNTATAGGALYVGGTASARLLNVSVVSNTAASGGGLYGAPAATLGVSNTLLSGNSAGNCAGQVDAGTHNLEWPGLTCVTAGPAAGFTSADPLLGPLALNAPGTTATHALLAYSPARDAGLAAVCAGLEVNNRDQRGAVRPYDGDTVAGAICDIGAYEAQDTSPNWLLYLPLVLR